MTHVLTCSGQQNSIKHSRADSRLRRYKHSNVQKTASISRVQISEPCWWRRFPKRSCVWNTWYHCLREKILLDKGSCRHGCRHSSDCVWRWMNDDRGCKSNEQRWLYNPVVKSWETAPDGDESLPTLCNEWVRYQCSSWKLTAFVIISFLL
jgi:hypothetical protein